MVPGLDRVRKELILVAVQLLSPTGTKEDPMSQIVERTHPGWMRKQPGPDVTEDTRPADGAWRLWETLRGWDQRFALMVDASLAAGLFVLCSGWLFVVSRASHPDLWFVAGLTLPLVLRRRAPIAVFLVLAVVSLLQWSITGPLLADSALLVALYTVAAECDWIAVVAAALIVEIGVILATARWTPVGSYFKSLVFLSGMASAALLAGVVVRTLRSQFGWLAERAHRLEIERDQQTFLAAAAERARIAREMHDVVSHNIQVMVTLADAAAVAQRSDPHRAAEAMAEVSGTGRHALSDMRRLLGLLRDGTVTAGVGTGGRHQPDAQMFAPQPGLTELEALTDRVRSTGLAVAVEHSGQPFALSAAAELTVYRIVQEALTNVLKHAPSARSARVELSFDDPEVGVLIVDDGVAAPVLLKNSSGGPVASASGHGLVGMSERSAAFGGILTAGPGSDGGWRVAATLRGCRAPAHA